MFFVFHMLIQEIWNRNMENTALQCSARVKQWDQSAMTLVMHPILGIPTSWVCKSL